MSKTWLRSKIIFYQTTAVKFGMAFTFTLLFLEDFEAIALKEERSYIFEV